MKTFKFILFILITTSFFVTSPAVAQEISLDETQTDSTKYYTNLNNQFILRLYTSHKSNNVDIRQNDKILKLRPNGTFSFGIGFNYKFLGLGISYGATISKNSKDKYGTTQRLDIQFSIFSKNENNFNS